MQEFFVIPSMVNLHSMWVTPGWLSGAARDNLVKCDQPCSSWPHQTFLITKYCGSISNMVIAVKSVTATPRLMHTRCLCTLIRGKAQFPHGKLYAFSREMHRNPGGSSSDVRTREFGLSLGVSSSLYNLEMQGANIESLWAGGCLRDSKKLLVGFAITQSCRAK